MISFKIKIEEMSSFGARHNETFNLVLFHKNSNMKFLWHGSNGKIDHISRWGYVY